MASGVRKKSELQDREESRALASYYRAGGRDHPDHSLTQHYIVGYKVGTLEEGTDLYAGRKYIRFANDNGILAVFSRSKFGDLKRLKRWPKSVDDCTAQTEDDFYKAFDAAMEEFYSKQVSGDDPELESLLDGLQGI